MSKISQKLRQRIAQQALSRCGYCLTQEIVSGIPLKFAMMRQKYPVSKKEYDFI